MQIIEKIQLRDKSLHDKRKQALEYIKNAMGEELDKLSYEMAHLHKTAPFAHIRFCELMFTGKYDKELSEFLSWRKEYKEVEKLEGY